ncbi:hypothetical protein BHE74_00050225 [Ensete ventricosum]|nr:hypothetical protein BHE74_00050225 [Ensete ventricosum]
MLPTRSKTHCCHLVASSLPPPQPLFIAIACHRYHLMLISLLALLLKCCATPILPLPHKYDALFLPLLSKLVCPGHGWCLGYRREVDPRPQVVDPLGSPEVAVVSLSSGGITRTYAKACKALSIMQSSHDYDSIATVQHLAEVQQRFSYRGNMNFMFSCSSTAPLRLSWMGLGCRSMPSRWDFDSHYTL